MSKRRDEQKGTPKADPRDEPRRHGEQSDEREHWDDMTEGSRADEPKREDENSEEADRTYRAEPHC